LNDLNGQSFLELLNFEPPLGVRRFERSEAVELLERLEPALFDEHQGITHSAKLKKRIRKILTGTSVPLDLPPKGRLRVGLRPNTPGAPGIAAKRSPLINRDSKVPPVISHGEHRCAKQSNPGKSLLKRRLTQVSK
jgi:hypothetical protein